MQRLLGFILITTVITAVLFNAATPGLAQDVSPTEAPPLVQLESGIVPFSVLGEKDITLRGPYSSENVRFTIPSSWLLETGTSINLVITAAFSSAENLAIKSSGANLEVTVNGFSVATLFITNEGRQIVNIPIPLSAIDKNRLDGRQQIEFSLDAAFDCLYPHETIIIIHAESSLNLPHSQIPTTPDLTILPRPFYEQYSFLPESAILVIPNTPTSNELQAALTVSTAFGRMSNGELELALIRAEELSSDLRINNNLIIIGNSNDLLTLLQQVTFPTANAQPGDGILQVAVSPWNNTRVVMHVSGTDEAGLLKAAQALTFGLIQPGDDLQTAIVSNINPNTMTTLAADVRTFADIGYPTRSVTGFGTKTLEYNFYIPPGYVIGNDPHLILNYSHSALLSFVNSSVTIDLNDQMISSFQLSESSATQLNTLKIPLYTDFIQTGDNHLVVRVDMIPFDVCSAFIDRGLWFTVNSSSLINLPLAPAEPGSNIAFVDLSQFPFPLTSTPTLSDVGFVVARNDFYSWKAASKLAAQLGHDATGQLLTPQLAFADAVTDEFLANHLILVGIPSNLPLINQMADSMPAPFDQGSNIVTERTLTVEYRLPTNTSLGYIQLFNFPQNANRVVFAILGSTPEGLEWAINAMTTPSIRGSLTGNFAVINRTQILATDTRITPKSIVPGAEPVLTPMPDSTLSAEPNTRDSLQPASLLPAIIAISLMIAGVVVFVLFNFLRQAKQNKQ